MWSINYTKFVRNHGKIYIPKDKIIIIKLLRINYDDPWQKGYSGRDRTIEIISRYYWWPRIKHKIRTYIDKYDIYQRITIRHYKLYRKLIPLPQPEDIWKEISIDFITDLPPSFHREIVYNTILVVIDRYSKMI